MTCTCVTAKTFDTREQAQVRIEAYLNKGPEWAGYLFENHIAGQRVIQLFQRTTDTVPNVGQTLVLIENEGLGTQKEQYVRATSVSVVERTFTYNNDQDYKARRVGSLPCRASTERLPAAVLADPERWKRFGASPERRHRTPNRPRSRC